jgi:hypothetical protein
MPVVQRSALWVWENWMIRANQTATWGPWSNWSPIKYIEVRLGGAGGPGAIGR